jgi:hypothetical protein
MMLREIAARLVVRTADAVMETRYRLAHLWAIASAPQELPVPVPSSEARDEIIRDVVRALDGYLTARSRYDALRPVGISPSDPEIQQAFGDLPRDWPSRYSHAWQVPTYAELSGKRMGQVDEARLHLKRVLAAVLARPFRSAGS